MVVLMKLLGPDYAVGDKGTTIHFKQPGRTTLYARITVDEDELESIRVELVDNPKLNRVFHIDWTDAVGNVHASIEKTIHIRRKDSLRNVPARLAQARRPVAT